MSQSAKNRKPLLAVMLLVVAVLSILLIWQGSLAVGIAMLAIGIALSGPLFRKSATPGKASDEDSN